MGGHIGDGFQFQPSDGDGVERFATVLGFLLQSGEFCLFILSHGVLDVDGTTPGRIGMGEADTLPLRTLPPFFRVVFLLPVFARLPVAFHGGEGAAVSFFMGGGHKVCHALELPGDCFINGAVVGVIFWVFGPPSFHGGVLFVHHAQHLQID